MFYNLQRPYQYNEKMAKLKADLHRMLGMKVVIFHIIYTFTGTYIIIVIILLIITNNLYI